MRLEKSPHATPRFLRFVLGLNLFLILGFAFGASYFLAPGSAEAGAYFLQFYFIFAFFLLLVTTGIFLWRGIHNRTFYFFDFLAILSNPLLIGLLLSTLNFSKDSWESLDLIVWDPFSEKIPEEFQIQEEPKTPEPSEEEKNLSPYITKKTICDDANCWYPITLFLDAEGNPYEAPAGTVNTAGDAWIYTEGHTIFAFNALTRQKQELMSVLDTNDGVSFKWNQDDSKLAIVTVNQTDESYHATRGTKLFVFSFDETGNVLQKDRYNLKIKYGCHDAGCDSEAGKDFYFSDTDTLIYYTWEDDYYIERTDEWKRFIDL